VGARAKPKPLAEEPLETQGKVAVVAAEDAPQDAEGRCPGLKDQFFSVSNTSVRSLGLVGCRAKRGRSVPVTQLPSRTAGAMVLPYLRVRTKRRMA